MPVTLRDILEALPHLSASDLGIIRSRIKAAIAVSGNEPEGEPTKSNDLIVEAMQAAWQKLGLGPSKREKYPQDRDGSKAAMEFSARATRTLAEQRSLLIIGFELMIRDHRKRRIPINPTTLVSNAGSIPGLIDRAFPGYAQSGLLPFVLSDRADTK
jgi:hypothetical protein